MSKLLLPNGYQDTDELSRRLNTESESDWKKKGEARALSLFHQMSERVPGYKDFLKSKNFSPASVQSIEDFKKIPTVDKDNYLRRYSRQMLSWDGGFPKGQWVISTTSGSTGEPFYFPREVSQDRQYAITADLYLRNNFDIKNKKTLYIVAFPMGAWIGGLFTYEALKILAQDNDYDLSIITPGIHKQEVINAVKQLGEDFDQIIIGAYAPFLKDILDDGQKAGIVWSEHNMGFIFSAEAFSEQFRDYVIKMTKPDNQFTFSLNHYGTVDLGTMAHETPESIFIRRQLAEKGDLGRLFPEKNRQPTFAQFNPELFYFEEINSNLLCTAYSGIPLVRYDLKDYGGLLSREKIYKQLAIDQNTHHDSLKENHIDKTVWNLPFIYVYERNDFSVSYYAFLIYPDMVRRALQNQKFDKLLTGKFTMFVEYDKGGRQRLHINCEMKAGVMESSHLNNQTKQTIHDNLVRESSEYRETAGLIGNDALPIVKLWSYEDPKYFRAGTKQKWVIK